MRGIPAWVDRRVLFVQSSSGRMRLRSQLGSPADVRLRTCTSPSGWFREATSRITRPEQASSRGASWSNQQIGGQMAYQVAHEDARSWNQPRCATLLVAVNDEPPRLMCSHSTAL